MATLSGPSQGDSDNKLLQKICSNTSGGGSVGPVTVADGLDVTQGAKADARATDSTSSWSVVALLKGIFQNTSGAGSAVSVADGADVAQGAKADAKATDSSSSWTIVALLKGILDKLLTSIAVTNTNLDVALSTRLKPADTLTAVTTVATLTTVTNPVTVTQTTASNLKVDLSGTAANATAIKVDGSAVTQPVSGNVGGKTTVIKDTTAVSTSPAYTAGDAVGGKRTLSSALATANTGVLQSITLLDRANQKAAMTLFIFDADPTNATITDNSAFAFSTDDLKVIAQVSINATDYVTTNSKALASIGGLNIALKAGGTTLYAALVTSGTPTFANTTDVQLEVGILQD